MKKEKELRKALFDTVTVGTILSRATPPYRPQRVAWKGAAELKLEPFGRPGGGVLVKRDDFNSSGYVIAVES